LKIIIPIIAVLSFLAAVWLMLYANRICSTRRRRIRAESHKRKQETTKKMIWVCLINGFAWVWCSYILAYLDKTQIAESLSQVAVTEIIGVVLAYCIKSAVENLSKNNHWPDKPDSGGEPPPDTDAG
jgi:cytosine/uracil/thiamine/allantoin permease